MKRLLLILLLLPVFASHNANAQEWVWAKVASGGQCEGYYSATDASNSIYVAGYHFGTIYLGIDTVIGSGDFIVKYDSIGNIKWAISTNSVANTSAPLGLVTDLYGNEYLLGWHDTAMSFGPYVLNIPGSLKHYYYLAKIDSTGNVVWVENIGNVQSYSFLYGDLRTDPLGNILLTCSFSNNPTISSFSLVNSDTNATNDILVSKFDSSGSVIWAKSFGGKNDDNPLGIAITPSNAVYIAGYFNSDTLTFGTSVLFHTGTSLLSSAFLAKLDSFGNPIWAQGAGGGGYDRIEGLATASEDVYIVGVYARASVIIGSYILPFPFAGSRYGYLAKYDSSGGVLWVKNMQGRVMNPWKVAVDPCENIWLSGELLGFGSVSSWTDTIDGHVINPPSGSLDPMFIAGWSSTGAYLQSVILSSGGDDLSSVTIDKCGNIFVEGDYEVNPFIVGNDTFYTGSGEYNFVAKYNPSLGCTGNCGDSILITKSKPISNHSIFIYPNPTTTQLTIQSPNNPITQLTITNLLGQTVYTDQYNSEQVQIDVSNYPAGVYFIKVNSTEVRKFVKE